MIYYFRCYIEVLVVVVINDKSLVNNTRTVGLFVKYLCLIFIKDFIKSFNVVTFFTIKSKPNKEFFIFQSVSQLFWVLLVDRHNRT